MTSSTMMRLLRATLAPADDAEGQAELGRMTRLLGLQEMLGSEPRPWVSVDPLHDMVEQEWSALGMPAAFEWIYAWAEPPITDNGELVLIRYIRRSLPTPNGCRGLDVPLDGVRAFEGFGFRVLGLVVPSRIDPSCWSFDRASGTSLVFMEMGRAIQIPGHGEISQFLTAGGLVKNEGPFTPTNPNKDTMSRAKRALTTSPKNLGGAPKGARKAREWDRRRILLWYREASDDYAGDGSTIMLKDLAAAMRCSVDTAGRRLDAAVLDWPPTEDDLAEVADVGDDW